MRRLSSWLVRRTPGWLALLASIAFLFFSAAVLPRQAARADQAGGDAGSPDTSFFYSPADLASMADAYGPQGRRAYVQARYTFDVAWPLVYGLFLVTSISWLSRRGFPAGSPWQISNLVPLAAVLFDVLENLSTSLVMLRFPEPAPMSAMLAPWFTLLKWILVGASMLLLLISAGKAVLSRRVLNAER